MVTICGIAGIHVRSDKAKINLNAVLDTMLGEIQHRGGDATGFLAMTSEGVGEWQRAAVDVEEFLRHRRRVPKGTRTILAHTRWATQGHCGFMENNHPLRRGPFYVIHNGHVTNDDELFKMAGRERYAQVDTEAIPAYIAHLGELARVNEAMEEIHGAAAIAVVDERFPDELVLARGYDSPLNVLVTDKVVMWGSTEKTVRLAYKKHVGRLGRRQRIEAIPEGLMLYITTAGVQRIEFKPYSPPAYTYQRRDWGTTYTSTHYGEKWDWDKTTGEVHATERLSDHDLWDEDEEFENWRADDILDQTKEIECDECGGKVALMNVIRVAEPDTDFEWKLCEDCCNLWEKLTDDEFNRANEASLNDR